MCRGRNYLLSRSTHSAVRSHWIGGAGNHHIAFISSNVVKQMKDKSKKASMYERARVIKEILRRRAGSRSRLIGAAE